MMSSKCFFWQIEIFCAICLHSVVLFFLCFNSCLHEKLTEKNQITRTHSRTHNMRFILRLQNGFAKSFIIVKRTFSWNFFFSLKKFLMRHTAKNSSTSLLFWFSNSIKENLSLFNYLERRRKKNRWQPFTNGFHDILRKLC